MTLTTKQKMAMSLDEIIDHNFQLKNINNNCNKIEIVRYSRKKNNRNRARNNNNKNNNIKKKKNFYYNIRQNMTQKLKDNSIIDRIWQSKFSPQGFRSDVHPIKYKLFKAKIAKSCGNEYFLADNLTVTISNKTNRFYNNFSQDDLPKNQNYMNDSARQTPNEFSGSNSSYINYRDKTNKSDPPQIHCYINKSSKPAQIEFPRSNSSCVNNIDRRNSNDPPQIHCYINKSSKPAQIEFPRSNSSYVNNIDRRNTNDPPRNSCYINKSSKPAQIEFPRSNSSYIDRYNTSKNRNVHSRNSNVDLNNSVTNQNKYSHEMNSTSSSRFSNSYASCSPSFTDIDYSVNNSYNQSINSSRPHNYNRLDNTCDNNNIQAHNPIKKTPHSGIEYKNLIIANSCTKKTLSERFRNHC